MASYDDMTLKHNPPILLPDKKEHVLIMQDESIFHTNKYCWHSWATGDQQPIQKKGGGCAIHVSDFICKTIGRIRLSKEQIQKQRLWAPPPLLPFSPFYLALVVYD